MGNWDRQNMHRSFFENLARCANIDYYTLDENTAYYFTNLIQVFAIKKIITVITDRKPAKF